MALITDLFSPNQIDSINNSNNKVNIWEGAVSSGKTYASLWRFYKECRDGPDGQFVILSKTYDTFKRNVLRELEKILGSKYVKYYLGKRELYIKNRLVHVIGCDDASAESKIRGPTFAGAYVDEITLIPESAFMMLLSRLRIPGAKLFGTTNPDSPFHWLKKYMDGNSDVTRFQFLMDDNPFITADYKEFIKRQYSGMWYQRFIQGLWVQAEGAIYDFFSRDLHTVSHVSAVATEYIVGIDYGTTNACAFVLIGCSRDSYPNFWVEAEYYWDSKVKQRQKTDGEYLDDFKQFINGKYVKAIYIDPAAASFKLELQKAGFPIYDAKNDVLTGIRFVSKLLSQGTFKICHNCVNLIKEFQSYVWDPKSIKSGEDKPLKENDHALDATRYALFTHLFGKSDSMSSQDIDRLYNETRGVQQDLPRFFQDPKDYGRGYY